MSVCVRVCFSLVGFLFSCLCFCVERVHPPKHMQMRVALECRAFPNSAACTNMYESINHRPTGVAQRKKQGFTTVLGDRDRAFDERVARRQTKLSVPLQFWTMGTTFLTMTANKVCVSRQFRTMDTTLFTRGCTTANTACISLQFWAFDPGFSQRG